MIALRLLLAYCALPLGCTASSGPVVETSQPAATVSDQLAVLTSDNRLFFVDPVGGRIAKSLKLDRDQPWGETVWPSPRLDQSKGGQLAVLTSWGNLMVVEPGTGDVISRVEVGRQFTSLASAPRSGRIALFGSENLDGVIEVWTLESTTPAATYRVTGSARADWSIYAGAWAPDESRLYVSYHGNATTGVDWFTVGEHSLTRCTTRQSPRTGCIDAHGALRVYSSGLIVATGSSDVLVVDSAGHLQRTIKTRVTGHLMEFAVDVVAHTLYAAGPCGSGFGFSARSLADGTSIGHESNYGCASLIESVGANVVAMTGDFAGVAILDARSGEVKARLDIPGPIVDLLLVRGGFD